MHRTSGSGTRPTQSSYQDQIDDDPSVLQGYSGTFRWSADKVLPRLPPASRYHCGSGEGVSVDEAREELNHCLQGWMEYLIGRCTTPAECNALISNTQSDLSVIDCLSSPITIAYMLNKLKILPHNSRKLGILNIVCIGSSSKCEERVLRETNCWNELFRFFDAPSDCKIWLVGPEISTSVDVYTPTSGGKFGLYRGTAMGFFRAHTDLMRGSTVVVGLNCGFGNWENPLPKRYDLLFDWLPDLYFLTATKMPLVFTCANDFADLKGEVGVMQHVLGSKFIVQPSENPFSFASTLVSHSALSKKSAEAAARDYSRGNSFLYAVQGCDKIRRTQIDCSDVSTRTVAFLSAFMRGATAGETIALSSLEWGPLPVSGTQASKDQGRVAAAPVIGPKSSDKSHASVARPVVNSEPCAKLDEERETINKKEPNNESVSATNVSSPSPSSSAPPLSVQELASDNPSAYTVVVRWNSALQREATDNLSDIDVGYNLSSNQLKFTVASRGAEQIFLPSKPLQPDSLTAKYSKKRNELTLSAVPVL